MAAYGYIQMCMHACRSSWVSMGVIFYDFPRFSLISDGLESYVAGRLVWHCAAYGGMWSNLANFSNGVSSFPDMVRVLLLSA